MQRIGSIDGDDVHLVRLALPNGAAATLSTYGAALTDLVVPDAAGKPVRVVLGYDDLDAYRTNPGYLGVTVGRFANRIHGGRFTLDGRDFVLARNENGRTHLHGGDVGYGKRVWRLVAADGRSATFALTSPDGEEGYPGTVEARVTYTLAEPATLAIAFTATTDAPTLLCLTNHSYFALDPDETILGQRLTLDADRYLAADAALFLTGEIAPVAGTPYDFRTARPIGGATIDHYFVLDRGEAAPDALVRAARVEARSSGLALECWTTAPGVQVYDANQLAPTDPPGRRGIPYPQHAGLCLETQLFPDAPNRPNFPSAVLRPGEVWRQATEYRFEAG